MGILARGLAVLVVGAAVARGQVTSANGKPLAYDVVSVKTNHSGSGGMSISTKDDGFSATNMSLLNLIANAYQFDPHRIQGLTGWADSSRFDVKAKVAAEDMPALEEARKNKAKTHLLESALVDRFKLKVHRETREMPVYNLVVAKSGSKLKPTVAGEKRSGSMMMGRGVLKAYGVTSRSMESYLTGVVGRPVVDKTGLEGLFDIEMTWTPENGTGGAEDGPSIYTALQEQLGLRLDAAKAPVEVLVVDGVEKPDED